MDNYREGYIAALSCGSDPNQLKSFADVHTHNLWQLGWFAAPTPEDPAYATECEKYGVQPAVAAEVVAC